MSALSTDPNTGSRSRNCDNCNSALTHLGDFPDRLQGPATGVWRCYACNTVVSKPISSAQPQPLR